MNLIRQIMRNLRGRSQRRLAASPLDDPVPRIPGAFSDSIKFVGKILDDAPADRSPQEEVWLLWQSLTPREQEIAALVCMNYTTRQIAERLYISTETVKTHVEHIRLKFGVSHRAALRAILSGWDFSAWDR